MSERQRQHRAAEKQEKAMLKTEARRETTMQGGKKNYLMRKGKLWPKAGVKHEGIAQRL